MTVSSSFYRSSEGSMRPIVEMTETLSTNLKAALSVDRAAKSFLYNIGRSRSPKAAPKSAPSGTRARNQSLQLSSSNSMPSLSSRPVGGPTDGADFTTFEKCIHLKGSQLMKNLDDDKVRSLLCDRPSCTKSSLTIVVSAIFQGVSSGQHFARDITGSRRIAVHRRSRRRACVRDHRGHDRDHGQERT